MTDPSQRSRLHAAAVEGRAALGKLRELLTESERVLASEQRQWADAERRGQMAAGIGDPETQRIAEEFSAKHRERVAVLERKVEAQRAEIALLQRDVDAVVAQLKSAGFQAGPVPDPGPDLDGERLRSQLDHSAREAQADDLLSQLKKRMGR
ncbi:MAG: hypothetical protein WD934_09515 [Gemmatimonadales bacterium]